MPKARQSGNGVFVLPSMSVNDTDDNCVICMEPLTSDHSSSLDYCGHRFHSRCIIPALQRNPCCPLCRRRPPTAEPPSPTPSDSTRDDNDTAVRDRRRAIASSLRRSRNASASSALRRAAAQYRTLRDAIQIANKLFRRVHREAVAVRNAHQREYAQVLRRHARESRRAQQQWIDARFNLEDLQDKHRVAGDILAQEFAAA